MVHRQIEQDRASELAGVTDEVVISFAQILEAKPIDAFWVEVPVVDSPDDPEDLTGFRSFDLFVTLGANIVERL